MNSPESTTSTLGERIISRSQIRHAYALRHAKNRADVRAAQTLRFLVFNLELNEGLEQSFDTCLDADPFDDICDHLLVEDLRTQEVVGTYRLQTGDKARANLGFYSANEFDLSPFESVRSQIIELGRASVHSRHRNLAVLSLLWKGIAEYARERNAHYLIGCSSIPTLDTRVAARMYADMQKKHLAEQQWRTQPTAKYICPLEEPAAEPQKIPKLLGAYLSLGAKICGPPAIDREFKTIDFLTLFDLQSLSEASKQFLAA